MIKLLLHKYVAILSSLVFFMGGCANYSIKQGAEAYARGDFDEAAGKWSPHAKEGDPYAQFNIGIIWEQGLGRTPLNSEQAMQWYLLSARQGYTPAMVRLANLQHANGYNDAAQSWYVLAARWGNSDAATELKKRGTEVPFADLLAQKQYIQTVTDQQIVDAVILSLTYILDTALYYQYAKAHHVQPPITYQPTTHTDSGRNQTPGYQSKDAFGTLVNSNSNYQTKDYLGNIVNSSSCYQSKDSFGNLVRSTGCSQ